MAKTTRKEKYIVRQNKNNKVYFVVKFSYITATGTKTYTKCFTASEYSSEAECLNAACRHRDIKRAELASAGFAEDKNLTMDECFQIHCAKKHMPANTRRLMESNYKNYIQPDFGTRSVSSITALEIEESLTVLRNDRSDDVINRVYSLWRAIISTARKLRAVRYNVTEEVQVPKSRYYPKEKTTKYITDETFRKALEELSHFSKREPAQYNATLLSYLLIVCRYTGLRPSEAFALKRSNVNLEGKSIRIDCAYGSDENGRAIVATKTRNSIREIPLTFAAELALRSAMAMSANEFIFTKWQGKLFNSTDVGNTLATVCKRGNIERFSIYSLRHQFSSDMITSNVDPRTVMELMGHCSTEMTIGTYARSSEEVKRKALEEIGKRS